VLRAWAVGIGKPELPVWFLAEEGRRLFGTHLTLIGHTDLIRNQIHNEPSHQVLGLSCGRNASHEAPPAQIRTCGITAYGSCLG